MRERRKPQNLSEFLEEIRSLAQIGLHYTKDPYDRERYERLLELTAGEYSRLTGLSDDQIIQRFKAELGHITPKVGVDAAVFADDGKLLLIKRSDDRLWCLPCGWAEVGETPQESLRREVFEETNIDVDIGSLIEVFTRRPGAFGQPHTSYHMLYHCLPRGGSMATSAEALEVGFYDHREVSQWHRDHQERAERAYRFWLNKMDQDHLGRLPD